MQRLKLAIRENICVGDDMSIDGTVSRKYVEDDQHRVDVAIAVSTQHGPAYEASATVLLPREAG